MSHHQLANVTSYVERLRLYGGVPPTIQREVASILESLEAKLEQSEHNCDMLLRYIDQALRDARQLQASLDDWKSETPQDADTHRLRSTRAYQIVKGLEVALGPQDSERSARRDVATGTEMAGAENGRFRKSWRECCPYCDVWVDAHIVADGPIVGLQLTRTNEKPKLLNALLKRRQPSERAP